MRGSGASQDGRRVPPGGAEQQGREGEHQKDKGSANWQTIKEDLLSIKEGLKKEKDIGVCYTQRINIVITRVEDASRKQSAPQGVEARLDRIESLLRAPAGAPHEPPARGNTWAKIAAAGLRQAGVSQAVLPTRYTVRVQLAQAEGLGNEEILKEVKKTIPGAAAIRVLRSGDIDMIISNKATKDKAQGLSLKESRKIYKKDYLVEVPGVPLTVRIAGEKGGDNTSLAIAICESSRSVTPGLQISRIRWLHNLNRPIRDADSKPAKIRDSLIIGVPTQEIQRRAIRGGLIINAQLFDVRPFEKGLQAIRCFKC